MDHFLVLFSQFKPSAHTFYAGHLSKKAAFGCDGYGHLHFFKGGQLLVRRAGYADVVLSTPKILFFPRGNPHELLADAQLGADLVCANIDMGSRHGNPVGEGLPDLLILDVDSYPTMGATCSLIFDEAFSDYNGRQVALDHLIVYFLIQIVRHVAERGLVKTGVLAALTDQSLARAITAMHQDPRMNWSLESLADIAAMSRTSFANRFKSVVGLGAFEYLTRWRMAVAQQLLTQGKPVKIVAASVGYNSAAAFSRKFTKLVGRPPSTAIR